MSTIAAKLQSDIEQIGLKVNIQQIQSSELLNALICPGRRYPFVWC